MAIHDSEYLSGTPTVVEGEYTELVVVNGWLREEFDDSEDDANWDGCRRLACAVLHQAILDLDSRSWAGLREAEREDGTAFLVSSEPRWARVRDFWATVAGIDPDLLVERAKEML